MSDFYAQLPKKRVAAGALIRDAGGRVLLVEPTYKATWEIPGGVVEVGESPRAAVVREMSEELGLALPVGDLLCVDWNAAQPPADDAVLFVFDGGVLTDEQLAAIVLPAQELKSWRCASLAEAAQLVHPLLLRRLRVCLEPTGAVYLE